MYETCPKCRYQIKAHEAGDGTSCPACGVIFSKWLKSRFASEKKHYPETGGSSSSTDSIKVLLLGYMLGPGEKTNPVVFWSRLVLLVLLALWGWHFIKMDFVTNPFQIGRSFMHNINLIFHEAGHILFIPLGRFMSILGGSLFQVLMPLIVMFTFLIKNHNPFAASVGLWWAGQSLMDIAPYIDDAIDQKLVLLGGRTGADSPGYHDWGNILIDLDMLEKHRAIANMADGTGSVIIILAITWGAIVLKRQFANLG